MVNDIIIHQYVKLYQTEYEIVGNVVNFNGTISLNINGINDKVREGIIPEFTKLPFKIGKVDGSFYCEFSTLTSFENCPDIITGNLYAAYCNLTNMKFCPDADSIDVRVNPLTSLIGIPNSEGLNIFGVSWSANLPLLSLLRLKINTLEIINSNNDLHPTTKIIKKYMNINDISPSKRKTIILDCQKELIDAGFIGNASW
jgi:hypothetical protein